MSRQNGGLTANPACRVIKLMRWKLSFAIRLKTYNDRVAKCSSLVANMANQILKLEAGWLVENPLVAGTPRLRAKIFVTMFTDDG